MHARVFSLLHGNSAHDIDGRLPSIIVQVIIKKEQTMGIMQISLPTIYYQ